LRIPCHFFNTSLKDRANAAVALLKASIEGNISEVTRLLRAGADVNEQSEDQSTALQVIHRFFIDV
jgi:hypothetical protein